MRTFNLVIQDIRYAIPTLESATARDRQGAKRIARQRLDASPYHVGIQVRDEEELLFWFQRLHATAPDQHGPQAAF